MIQEEILKGNELIACFMDIDYEDISFIGEDGCNYPQIMSLKYHSSWDWLMPVVEKIESLMFFVRIKQKWCTIEEWSQRKTIFHCGSDKHTKIQATWEAIVQFIKWANQQKN